VPTDFSKGSRRALPYALAFAKRSGASITLLHVVHGKCSAIGRVADLALEEELKQGGAKKLNALVQQLLGDQVLTQMAVRIGSPAMEIVRAAHDLNADLIIISTRGRTGLKHLLLGSVTEAVIRHSPCPALVVREWEDGFGPAGCQVAAKKWPVIHKPCAGNGAGSSDVANETKNGTRL
jgi:universal stress protein A